MGLTEDVRRAIESIKTTSAGGKNPVVNTVLTIDEMPDLDAAIRDSQGLDADFLKDKKQTEDAVKQVRVFQAGNVGTLQRMSTAQMANIKAFSAAPFAFVTRSIFRKLFKGIGILFLIEIARQVADIILQEFFKPGRLFDVRFRQQIDKQVIKFLTRKEQQELKQGFKQVITTTIGGLRGSSLAGQIGGNFFNPERIPVNFVDERRIADDNLIAQNAQERTGLQNARNSRGNNRNF